MANNKDNVSGSFGGSAAGASTTAHTSDSKLAKPAKKLKSENTNHPDHSALDDLVFGGCSTCGSFEHDTVQCGDKIPTVYMMSSALQTDAESPAPTTADTSASTGFRDSSVEKGDQAESGGPVSHGKRRRSSM